MKMLPKRFGVGYEFQEPLAESADDYETDYPDSAEDIHSPQYHEVIHEVLTEVEGYVSWAGEELGTGTKAIEEFVELYGEDYPHDDLWFTLEGYEEPDGYKHRAKEYHFGKFQAHGPLDHNSFLERAVERDYSPEDIAELFNDLTAEEVNDELLDRGLKTRDYITIGGTDYKIEDHHVDLYKDRAILEAFDKAGHGIEDVARRLRVPKDKVRNQVELHNLDA